MDAKFELVGYKNLERKKDKKPMTIAICMADCSVTDNSYGSYGRKSVEFFLPDDKVGTLTPEHLGKQFIPSYEINGFGRPALSGYTIR